MAAGLFLDRLPEFLIEPCRCRDSYPRTVFSEQSPVDPPLPCACRSPRPPRRTSAAAAKKSGNGRFFLTDKRFDSPAIRSLPSRFPPRGGVPTDAHKALYYGTNKPPSTYEVTRKLHAVDQGDRHGERLAIPTPSR